MQSIRRLDYEILDVTPGIYSIEVYSIGANLKESTLPASLTVQAFGKTAPPKDITGVSLVPGDELNGVLSWDRATELDVLLGGRVLIRHSTALVGAQWDRAQDLVPAAAGSQTQKLVPLLNGTYLLKFEDDTGNRSINAATVVVSLPTPQPRVLVNSYAENTTVPPFQGSLDNLVYSSDVGGLIIDSGKYIDDMALDNNFDGLASLDSVGGVNPTEIGRAHV